MVDVDKERERQIAYFREKYDLNPHSRTFAPLADLHRQRGELETAAELLEEGLTHHPDFVAALVILGRTRAEQGDGGAARAAWQRVMALDPDNVVALALLAADASERSAWLVAVQLYQRLVRLDPVDEEAVAQLREARARAAEEDSEGASRSTAPASEAAPPALPTEAVSAAAAAGNSRLATVTLADIYVAQGYRDKAIAVLQTLLERDPDRQDILERLAILGQAPDAGSEQTAEQTAAQATERESDQEGAEDATDDPAAAAAGAAAEPEADPEQDPESERENASAEIAPGSTGPLPSPRRRFAADQKVEQDQFASWLRRIEEKNEES